MNRKRFLEKYRRKIIRAGICPNRHKVIAQDIGPQGACNKCQHKRSFKSRLENPRLAMYHVTKRNAKVTGRAFKITKEDIPEIPKVCPIFPWIKIKVNVGKGGFSYNSPSIDRIRNDRGYIPGNIRIVSWRANRMKLNGTSREFKALWKDVRKIENMY